MKKIIYVNAIIRKDESRTKRLADGIISSIKEEVELKEINLNELPLTPYNEKTYEDKVNNGTEQLFYDLSKEIADSDGLIIASPFWDMSFPALLKSFLEKISLFEVMFVSDDKQCNGIAKCPFMYYIVTRGMDIKDGDILEQGTSYLKALCWLWGIKRFEVTSCSNFDYLPNDRIDEEINKKIKEGRLLLKDLIK
jgi:FMN-dependent NADH-azoreductase